MKVINLLTLFLVIVGGINWGLVGAAQYDLVAEIFGAGTAAARTVYILVGISALWQLIPFFRAFTTDEPIAQRNTTTTTYR